MPSTIKHPRLLLATLLVAAFMGQFDFFVVNVAAPAIQGALDASEAQLELVVGGYAFAYASGLITGGRLGDMYGHRKMYLWGLVLFAATSLLCGVAGSAGFLVFARIVQGFAAAVMIPQVLAAINVVLPGERRGWAMAWYGVAAGLGSIAGQILGGWFIHADLAGLGWRAIFLINVPIAALTFIAALLVVPQSRRADAPSIDARGATGIAVSLALVLLPFVLGRQNGWPAWMWIGPVVGSVLLWVVIRAEDRLSARGGDPILDTKLITVPSLARGAIASILFMAFFASFMFRLTVLLQQGEHIEPLHAGLMFAPSGVTFALSSLFMRGWITKNRQRAIRTGAIITIFGLAVATLGLTIDKLPTVALIVAAVCLTGFGNGLALPTLIGVALSDVPPMKAGVASGIVTAAQQFAASAGVALLGTLYFSRAASVGHQHAMAWTFVVDVVLLIGVILVGGFSGHSKRKE
ncbi:MFS transporter [uncultured Corynebacterium sp.]|uniref:MFS transporter n=1 Tax=uncultured Corynebacterium sp. TaxID=159447 RepID=UPI0025D591A7|nr:MFS transporter [uncultured Corynebacterium sp.]